MLHLKYTKENDPTQQELEKHFNSLIGKEVEVIVFDDESFDLGALSYHKHKGKLTRIEAYINDRNQFLYHYFHFDNGCDVEVHYKLNDRAPWEKATPEELEENSNLKRTNVLIGWADYPSIIKSDEIFIESCVAPWDVTSIIETFGIYYPEFDSIELSDKIICKALRSPHVMGDMNLTTALLNRAG